MSDTDIWQSIAGFLTPTAIFAILLVLHIILPANANDSPQLPKVFEAMRERHPNLPLHRRPPNLYLILSKMLCQSPIRI